MVTDNNKIKEKPLILRVRDAEARIITAINNSNVPAFILKSSIEKIYNQLVQLEQQEYAIAIENEKKEASENAKKTRKN